MTKRDGQDEAQLAWSDGYLMIFIDVCYIFLCWFMDIYIGLCAGGLKFDVSSIFHELFEIRWIKTEE